MDQEHAYHKCRGQDERKVQDLRSGLPGVLEHGQHLGRRRGEASRGLAMVEVGMREAINGVNSN